MNELPTTTFVARTTPSFNEQRVLRQNNFAMRDEADHWKAPLEDFRICKDPHSAESNRAARSRGAGACPHHITETSTRCIWRRTQSPLSGHTAQKFSCTSADPAD